MDKESREKAIVVMLKSSILSSPFLSFYELIATYFVVWLGWFTLLFHIVVIIFIMLAKETNIIII